MSVLMGFLRRYAPFLAAAAAVLMFVILVPSRPAVTPDSLALDGAQSSEQPGASIAGEGQAGPLPGAAASNAPGTVANGTTALATRGGAGPVPQAGGAPPPGAGDLPCSPRPVLAGCKPGWAGGSNGGATGHNVTADRVTVVWYVVYVDPALRSAQAAAGTAYSEEEIRGDVQALQSFLRKNVQLYGRKLDVVPYFGSHPVSDNAGLKAEAVEIDQKVKAFAVTAATMPVALSDELVRRKVLAWNTFQQPANYYASKAPYAWSVVGDADLLNASTAEYASKRLAGKKAQFGGADVQGKTRRFGLAYEGVISASAKDLIARMEAEGTPFVTTVEFGSELATAEQDSINAIAQFKAADVTTVICIGNVFAPLFLTKSADNQQYYPEWFVNAYLFQDAEEAARQYTPTQWEHAFGFTQLALRRNYKESRGYAASKDGDPSWEPTAGIALMFTSLSPIARGIEAAGPALQASTFQRGLFSLPALSGSPTETGSSYGSNGPGPYTGIDDFAEIWWNPTDTQTFDGKPGSYARTNGGRRIQLGQWPRTTPQVFS